MMTLERSDAALNYFSALTFVNRTDGVTSQRLRGVNPREFSNWGGARDPPGEDKIAKKGGKRTSGYLVPYRTHPTAHGISSSYLVLYGRW
jgi:hypothetical protein